MPSQIRSTTYPHAAPATLWILLMAASMPGCVQGGSSRSVTAIPAAPAASPAFITLAPAAPAPAPEPATSTEIENVTRVTYSAEGADFDPSISRDGTTIVFSSTQHSRSADIFVKPVGARVVTRLTSDPADDVQPAISPDGTRIAFASNRYGNWDIFIMPITGGQAVQITDDAADELHPSWSPDGSQLVFSRFGQISGRWELWVTGANSKAAAPAFIGFGMFPEWCPTPATGVDGSDRILFQLGRERGSHNFSIWTLDYQNGQTSNLTELASSTNTAFISPTWSPDGRQVVYAEVPVAEANAIGKRSAKPSASDLFLISTDGTNKVRLTSGNAVSMFPKWGGPRTLFFVSDRNGQDNIWSMDLGSALVAMGELPVKSAVAKRPAPPASRVAAKSGSGISLHDTSVATAEETPAEPQENEHR